jgi:hypothetical protein
MMANQLLDVALGKPLILASEQKAVPISKQESAKFEGKYELSPGVSFTFVADGDVLDMEGGWWTLVAHAL